MSKPAIYYVNYFCMDDSLDDAKSHTPRDEHEDIRAYVELESYDKLEAELEKQTNIAKINRDEHLAVLEDVDKYDEWTIKLQAQIEKLEAERDELKSDLKMSKADNQMAVHGAEVILQREINSLTQERDKLKADRDEWRLRCMNADDEANKHAQENEELKKAHDDLVSILKPMQDLCKEIEPTVTKLTQDRTVLVEALNSIIAKSHSWLMTRETGMIEKPIHDSYRNLAKSILQKIGEV